jgi:shikimate kinase/3-dehydroquinate synthase
MGSGKSVVAKALAVRLGRACIDVDDRIAELAGPIPRIFQERGEAAFRRLEGDIVRELLDGEPAVVALGGGAVVDLVSRRSILSRGLLITLEAPLPVLLRRVGGGAGRPLLQPDPGSRLASLLEIRRGAYAECHARVRTDERTPEEIAAEIAAIASEVRVAVPLGEASYVVEIGAGYRARLADRLEPFDRPVLVGDENTARYRDELADPRAVRVTLESGEEHKGVDAVARIWDAALEAGVDRGAIVTAVGGGVVGDLAGFAAASLLRGVAFGQVPTTLLAMVDSSVGGKTGFNRPAGKNLVGAFHQPRFVLCDPEVLATLPRRDRIAGLAEVVKSAWLEGEEFVTALEGNAEGLLAGELEPTVDAIRRSVTTKARVVAEDALEQGLRMHLNLGHTVGHGLEAAAGYGALRHGEAVSLGLVAAMRVGEELGQATAADSERMSRLLQRLGLPVDLDDRLEPAVWPFVAADKKRRGDTVRFVVPGPPGEVAVQPLSIGAVRRALEG